MMVDVAPSTHPPRFQPTISPRSTSFSLSYPLLSAERYEKLPIPSRIEIGAEALSLATQMVSLITKSGGGGCLIMDYGPSSTIPVNSLRAIKSHQFVSPWENPGEADLSVDVDFAGIKEQVLRAQPANAISVFGAVDQASFLTSLGIDLRKQVLAQRSSTPQAIDSEYERLLSKAPNGMGKLYKAMAILPGNRAGAVIPGFTT